MTNTFLPQSLTIVRLITLVVVLSSLRAAAPPAAGHARTLDAAPTLTVTAIATTTEQVDLRWTLAPALRPRLTQFQLQRDGMPLATFPATTRDYLDTPVQPSTAYRYTLLAQDASGQVLASWDGPVRTPALPETPDTTPPTPPEELEVIAASGFILLDWYYATDDSAVTAFLIRRNGQSRALVDSGTLQYRDTDVQPGTRYIYTVESIDVVGHHSQPETAPAVTAFVDANAPSLIDPNPTPDDTTGAPAVPSLVANVNAHLTRYPYLTDLVDQYVTINWATDRSGSTGAVTWGLVGTNGTCTPSTTVTATKTAITVNAVAAYQWKAMLTLTADTPYCYRVALGSTDLLGTAPAPQFWTQLPAGSTTPFTFAVFGDWGAVDSTGSNSDQANLMQQIAASGARFALTTGDNGYPSGSQTNYGDLHQTGGDTSAIFGPSFWTVAGASIPLFPILGNHGLSRSDTVHPHLLTWPQDQAVATSRGKYVKETYCCVNGSSAASYPSGWYAFDAGTARFYVLDAAWADGNGGTASPYENDRDAHWTPGTAEYQWLAQDLAAHPNALKFAFFHYPLYSANKHENGNTFLQGPTQLEGLLGSYGVAIAFNGHAHLYQRSRAASYGLVSYLTGGGGAKLGPIDGSCGSMGVYAIGWSYSANGSAGGGSACGSAPVPTRRAQVFHFLRVTVNGTQVTVAPTDSEGTTFDVQTYSFGSGTATATPISTPVQTTTPTSTPAQTTTPTSTPPSSVTTLTFTPEADARVYEAKPTTNYGTSSTLRVDGASDPDIESNLRFTVSGVAGTVQSATVRVYATSDGTTNGPAIYATGTTWAETSLTWNNRPARTSAELDNTAGIATNSWAEFNVTPLVTGNGVYSFVLAADSTDGATFSSREGSVPPQLVLTIATGTSSTATPAPTNTLTPTDAPTSTLTPTETATSTPTPIALPTDMPTSTPVLTSTATPIALPTETATSTPTPIAPPTETATSTATPIALPTDTPMPTNTPTGSTPIFSDGFESGNLSAWSSSGGLSVQGGTVYAGSFAAQGNTTNGGTYAKKTLPASYSDGYGRVYFNLTSAASQVNLLRFRTASDSSIAYLYVDTFGKLKLRNDSNATTTNSTTQVGSGWHALELHAIANGAASTTEVWLDSVKIDELSVNTNFGTSVIGKFQIGEVQSGRTYNVIFDDAVFDTQPIGP